MNYNLALPFYLNSLTQPDRLAISADGVELSYGDLAHVVRKMVTWLDSGDGKRPGRVGLLASRSIAACAGVLASCWAGGTYVPIGLKLPEERLANILALSDLDAVIADGRGTRLLTESVLAACPARVLVAERDQLPNASRGGQREIADLPGLDGALADYPPAEVLLDDTAYIEFTSGTTGIPKGVMITAGAVQNYVAVVQDRYRVTAEDRIAETSDLSFDISVSNMFMAWNAGASLHVVPHTQAFAPARFIRKHGITVWYSVPSVIGLLKSVNALPADAFPGLRCSVFAGEPLPVSAALAWKAAAPSSIIDNLYGPTEATVVCVGHRWTDAPEVTPDRDVVAIGRPFPGTEVAVLDEGLRFLPQGAEGELALAGVQLARGYLGMPELTAARFPVIGGKRWYLTGDRGFEDSGGTYHHLGRIDHQVKILGNRVELEEIETHLRQVSGTDMVAAVAWPTAHGSASGTVGFVCKPVTPAKRLRPLLAERLPAYMVPTQIISIPSLPLNANGKVDRRALVAQLDEGALNPGLAGS